MTKEELLARINDLEWEDFEVKAFAETSELDIVTQQKRLGIKLGKNRISMFFILYFSQKITWQNLLKILNISTTSVDNHIKWF